MAKVTNEAKIVLHSEVMTKAKLDDLVEVLIEDLQQMECVE